MEFLNYGMGFYFTRDYITKTRNYPKGTRCNILNGVVVLGKDGEFLFDVNSEMAKRFGQIINQDIFDKNEQKWSDLIDKLEMTKTYTLEEVKQMLEGSIYEDNYGNKIVDVGFGYFFSKTGTFTPNIEDVYKNFFSQPTFTKIGEVSDIIKYLKERGLNIEMRKEMEM